MSTGAPLETGSVIRYPATSLFSVSTDDGFAYTPDTHELIEGPNPSNLIINKGRTILSGYLTRLALTETQIEWNVPNVNFNNRTLTIQIKDLSGVVQTYARVILDPGFYSPAKLIRDLEAEINTNPDLIAFYNSVGVTGPYFEVFLADESGNPVITATSTPSSTTVIKPTNVPRVGIRLRPGAEVESRFNLISSQADTTITGKRKEYNDLLDMLGWTTSTGGIKSYTAYIGGFASFQYTPYIDLVSQTLTKNQKVSDVDSSSSPLPNKLARIYLSNEDIKPFYAEATYDTSGNMIGWDDDIIGTRPFTFRREFKYPKQIQWNTQQNIDLVELQILDYKGQFLPINFRSNDVLETIDPSTGEPYPRPLCTHDVPNFAEFRFTLHVSEN
jgi:hypothetical protein